MSASGSAPATTLDNNDDWLDVPMDELPPPDTQNGRKRRWYATTDNNLHHWVTNYRNNYLRVLITREGFMGEEACCPCSQPAKYRCSECYGGQMFCRKCLVEAHRLRPLCHIEAWSDTFFKRRELRQLGLRVQLGHPDNTPCPHAQPACAKFVVIALNGFHHVLLHWEQLLSYGWYPVTPDNPQSTITITALKLFHSISLQGKTTVYHFFNALTKITDNTGSKEFKRRYQLALRVVRQWRNLCTLKRGGMGNDPDRRTAQTREGELVVNCIACPKAGVNLPDDWEKAPVEMKHVPTPASKMGWAYFVRSLTYEEFMKTLGEQTEMSTCTSLTALDHANTKYSQGYTATGCGLVTCGRHEIVCKNSVGDLQASEKYGNMDYIFQIAHYFVKFVIPKMHILGHLKFCQDFFSLLFTLGAAQADMEGIERIWSSSGLMGASTREMGPGSRQDTLDDFWHYWNWNKVVGMGSMLRKHLLKAKKELVRQTNALQEFTQVQQGEVSAWKTAVDNFETGVSAVNPYELPLTGPTLREIKLELVREEQEHERSSTAVREATDDTMIEYLMLGVEIEGQQRQLSADLVAKRSPTTRELTDFITRRARILRQIKKLRLMQRKYSPGTLQRLVTVVDLEEAPEAEHAPLFLPSGLSPLQAMPPLSVPEILIAKAWLRDTQCSESLEAIRHGLIVKRRLQTYKTLNSRR
ncbi:hypothetical protein B0H14DRAFT_3510637 [Mycena olivaceomarginata]|nr:hypothetical protein B0H14DRAFT_3510637 [Mycena olivaceomarginata]